MFAGKTEHLIARLRAEQTRGRRVEAFKHTIDARYAPDQLVTHRGDHFAAIRVPDARLILDRADQVDVVAIDEGHFFKLPLVPVVEALKARGQTVLVAGITHDAWGRPFEPIPQLAAIADEVVLCQAPCRVCGQPSPYTQRMTQVNSEFMVGGVGDYEPRCAAHFVALPGRPEQH
jgi:thymidine kinase